MTNNENDLNFKATEEDPWGIPPNLPITQREQDRRQAEADKANYISDFGHVERRHSELAILYTVIKFTAAIVAGLIMALGFHPFITFIAAILIWRALEEVLESNNDADRIRRAVHGVD